MTINFGNIVGSTVKTIDIVSSGWSEGAWLFIELDDFTITLLCPWRYSIDNLFKFGWIERRDYLDDLRKSLTGKKVTLFKMSLFCDLKIEFQGGKVIEAFSVTKSTEQWTIVHDKSKSSLENDGGSEINYSGEWVI